VSSRSASGDVTPSGQAGGSPQAKPTDQVEFTKITKVTSAPINAVIGDHTINTATCPAGTTAIGGNYNITLFVASASFPWFRFWNEQAGAREFSYNVTAYCAS
jgi:hypothetical protein